ncbi:MAG: hypothetical protein H6741_03905 [Alphaproteobacteria bacterium]|nr:hypothetical protein [Alphaproteobacteria bacterium]MCB9791850.1 hypothetical protein [Alphaproteobacteria bacterium]
MISLALVLLSTALADDASAEAEVRPSFEPYLLAQTWFTVYDQDVSAQADPSGYGDPEDDVGFKIRRARVGFTGEYKQLDYGVVVGVSSGADPIISDMQNRSVGIIDAYGAYTFGQGEDYSTRVVFGTQRVPYGRENLVSSRELTLQERTVASNHLGPFREVGVLSDTTLKGFRLRAGVFNGNESLYGDTDPGVMVAGRAEYTLGPGHAYQTYGAVEGFTLGVGAGALYNRQSATQTLSYGGDVIVRVGGLAAMVEGHIEDVSPVSTQTYDPDVLVETRRMGGYAQVGYTVKNIEPIVRFETFDDDRSTSDNGDLAIGVVGVTAHLVEDHLRLGGGYVMRIERGGQDLPNDTARLWSQIRF